MNHHGFHLKLETNALIFNVFSHEIVRFARSLPTLTINLELNDILFSNHEFFIRCLKIITSLPVFRCGEPRFWLISLSESSQKIVVINLFPEILMSPSSLAPHRSLSPFRYQNSFPFTFSIPSLNYLLSRIPSFVAILSSSTTLYLLPFAETTVYIYLVLSLFQLNISPPSFILIYSHLPVPLHRLSKLYTSLPHFWSWCFQESSLLPFAYTISYRKHRHVG